LTKCGPPEKGKANNFSIHSSKSLEIVVLAFYVCPLVDEDKKLFRLPDGRDWLWEIWVLLWLAGPCSVNL